MAGVDPISEEVRRLRLCWIGHVLRKEVNSDCAVCSDGSQRGREGEADLKLSDVAL